VPSNAPPLRIRRGHRVGIHGLTLDEVGRWVEYHVISDLHTAEGWSRDVSEDIALEILQRAFDADETLCNDTKRFFDRHVADPANPAPVRTGPFDMIDGLKPDFEERPAASSVRRGLKGYAKYRARDTRKD
jgi:hypothetical protein